MPISDAQKKAVRKYKENNYERIELSVPKGKKAVIKDFAEKQNKSVNGFVNEAIDEKMERDK